MQLNKMTTAKIIEKFQTDHRDLYLKMKETEHGYLGEKINPFHVEGSVWVHTMMVMREAERAMAEDWMMITALCHDIGKVYTLKDQDNERRSFNNHEGVSVFYAKKIFKSFDIDIYTNRGLFVIANHGSLYNFFEDGRIPEKHHNKIREKFSKSEFADLFEFFKYDHLGRISINPTEDLIFSDMKDILNGFDDDFNDTKIMPDKTLTILVGPPRSGKTTFLQDRVYPANKVPVIISRDKLVEEGPGTYSENWAGLTQDDHRAIDQKIQKQYNDAIRQERNIIIDMTNMSKKSRKKWINSAKSKGYFVKAEVFIEDPSVLKERSKDPEKLIPDFVIDSMIQRFVYPLKDEADIVHLV